jgi:hypothetical protein
VHIDGEEFAMQIHRDEKRLEIDFGEVAIPPGAAIVTQMCMHVRAATEELSSLCGRKTRVGELTGLGATSCTHERFDESNIASGTKCLF